MGIVLDLLPVESNRIEQLRNDIDAYYQLEQEKNVWIRIYREVAASHTKKLDATWLDFVFANQSDLSRSFTLGKNWDVLHYLLCGSTEVPEDVLLSKAILGGEELFPDQQWSYGSPVLLSVTETKAVAQALAALTSEDIQVRFEPKVIAELCYGVSQTDPDAQGFTTLVTYLSEDGYQPYWQRLQELVHYYALAAEQGMGMVKSKG